MAILTERPDVSTTGPTIDLERVSAESVIEKVTQRTQRKQEFKTNKKDFFVCFVCATPAISSFAVSSLGDS